LTSHDPSVPKGDDAPDPSDGQEEEALLVQRVEGTLLLTLNRPRRSNAIDQNLAYLLGEALDRADTDPAIRAVVLTGSGSRAFCAGGDLHALARGESLAVVGREAWGFAGYVSHFISKPTIAAVNGAALGGGFEILLASDIVLAVPHAVLGLPDVTRGGIASAGGLIRLPRQVPTKVAMMMLLSGVSISAEEAKHWGLVNEVVDPDRLVDRALELAAGMAASAPLALEATKRIAYGFADGRLRPESELWEINEREASRVRSSEDLQEGRRAFVEHRAPQWRGK
jgi:crotonobetainyl-CoA hydratase